MTARTCDMAIVGGGLAGGLIALALRRARPNLVVRLVEAGDEVGGNHRWSWFASDLTPAGEALMEAFPAARWDGGYDVAFPSYGRHLTTPYRSLASADFAATLARGLAPGTIITEQAVEAVSAEGVTLAGGERIGARAVIDCRGFAPTPDLSGGWQVFLGRHMRTATPHGVGRPVIMDATVAQLGGYRFVYVLPLAADELFIEDTYYQDAPKLDRQALARRVDEYCATHGWSGETLGEETGVLPVVTGGDFARWQAERRVAGVARAGAHAGFLHPLTSYTLPFAVETALAVARDADLSGPAMAAMLEDRARAHWRATKFYRRLGAMLFAAEPELRRRVFERFYRLEPGLIERFYAARSTGVDRLRVLCGKPPVPLGRAIGALVSPGTPLKEAA
ncbi:MAG: lycopene beta-cyclase CrtY [Croceibacterium sp.]